MKELESDHERSRAAMIYNHGCISPALFYPSPLTRLHIRFTSQARTHAHTQTHTHRLNCLFSPLLPSRMSAQLNKRACISLALLD